jgi:hypothetical protein
MLVMPAVFLVLNMWRFLWVLRHKLSLSRIKAVITMYHFFSLGWVVVLASIQGLFQPQGVFLRTPKAVGRSKVWRALQATRWESVIGTICLVAGIAAIVRRPQVLTFLLGGLLVWQAGLYLAAPIFSMLSIGAPATVQQAAMPRRAVPENWAARWAVGLALVVMVVGVVALLLPRPVTLPSYSRYQPPEVPPKRVFGIERVPIEERAFTPTPQPSPTVTPPEIIVTALPTSLPSLTPLPVTITPTPAATETPTQEPQATPTPQPSATPNVTPSSTLPPTATSTPGLGTPSVTITPGGTPFTLTPSPTGGIVPTLIGTPLPAVDLTDPPSVTVVPTAGP